MRKKSLKNPTIPLARAKNKITIIPIIGATTGDINKNSFTLSVIALASNKAIVVKPNI